MMRRLLVLTAGWLAAMAAILSLAAGDWGWPQVWAFLGEVAVSTVMVNLWLARHDPALLELRLSSPVQGDQRPWDRIFMLVALLVFTGWLVLCALDARRFGWSRVPPWVEAMGAVLIARDCPETWGIGRGKRALEPRFGCARRVGMADCLS